MEDRAREIVDTAHRRSRALIAKDVEALDAVLADSFVYTNATGAVLTKTEYLELYVRNPEVRWELQELDDVRVDLYGDAGVLVGRVHDVFVAPGIDRFDGWFRSTLVFVADAGRWRCVAGQATAAEPPSS